MMTNNETITIGRTTRKSKSKGSKVISKATVGKARMVATIVLGCFIPLFCLSMSHVGGSLLSSGSYVMGAAALALTIVALCVSLPHLADAIADITHSERMPSWFLAIAIDSALVVCELIGAMGAMEAVSVRISVMVCVTGLSMFLNCWAFLNHRPTRKGK